MCGSMAQLKCGATWRAGGESFVQRRHPAGLYAAGTAALQDGMSRAGRKMSRRRLAKQR